MRLLLWLPLLTMTSTTWTALVPHATQPTANTFQNFAARILQAYNISTILVTLADHSDCAIEQLLQHTNYTFILQNMQQTRQLRAKFNTQLLSIVCLNGDFSTQMLLPLSNALNNMRDTKTIFYIDYEPQSAAATERLEMLFRFCWQQKMLNVLAVLRDSTQYFSYQAMPVFTLLQHSTAAPTATYFPQRFVDLHGQRILTLPDQNKPRTVLQKDAAGRQVLGGYIGRFLQTLAQKLNATLEFPYPVKVGQPLHFMQLMQLLKNDTIDLTASIAPMLYGVERENLSYPFEISRSCTMFPVASDIPLKDIYLRVFTFNICLIAVTLFYAFAALLLLYNWQQQQQKNQEQEQCSRMRSLALSDFILNDVSLRGLLAQPFTSLLHPSAELKLIYMLLCVTGLYLSSVFQAHLQTLLTRPPKEKQIMNFRDSYDANLDILVSEQDIVYFQNYNFDALTLRFATAPFQTFRQRRNNLDTRYAYPVNSVGWMVYALQQQIYGKKLFLFSEEACFMGNTYYGIGMQANSLYRQPLERLILEAQSYGLIDHWFRHTLITTGTEPPKDAERTLIYGGPLTFDDLQWVWTIYASLVVASVTVFLGELLWMWLGRKLRKRHAAIEI